jgi:hypothetical protein
VTKNENTTPIPGELLPWRAGPDVARALGYTTETLYPWLEAMGVETIKPGRVRLVNCRSLVQALDLWSEAEKGGVLTEEDWSFIHAAKKTGKHHRFKSLRQLWGKELSKELDKTSKEALEVLLELKGDERRKAITALKRAVDKYTAQIRSEEKPIKSKKDTQ